MAQAKAAISRAMATTTWLTCLPRALNNEGIVAERLDTLAAICILLETTASDGLNSVTKDLIQAGRVSCNSDSRGDFVARGR